MAAIYLVDLGRTPVYFGGDEAHFGVVAHSIATTGRNLNGDLLPLFISLDDPAGDQQVMPWGRTWYQPMLFYLTAAALKVLPLTEASVRVPTAIMGGILIPLLTYAVAFRLLANRLLAIAAALVIALAPPQIILSRQALDYICPLPFMLGWLWFLIDFTETRRVRSAAISGLLLGLGCYSYIAAWVMMPIYLAMSWYVFYRVDSRWMRSSLAAAAGFALPMLLVVPWLWSHPEMLRETFDRYQMSDQQEVSLLQDPANAFGLDQIQATISTYWDHFDPAFLFLVGGPIMTTSTGRVGVFLVPVALFLPLGIWTLLRRRDATGLHAVLLVGLITAPIAATLKGQSYMVQRILFMMPFAAIVCAFGLAWLWESRRRALRYAVIAALAIGTVQFAVFYRDFFTHYKLRSAFYYDPAAFVDVAGYLMADPAAPTIYMSTEVDDAATKWRFYTTKEGRVELLQRTQYFNSDGMDLAGAKAGSLLVMYMKSRELAALERTGLWKIEKVVSDVDNRATTAILRKVG